MYLRYGWLSRSAPVLVLMGVSCPMSYCNTKDRVRETVMHDPMEFGSVEKLTDEPIAPYFQKWYEQGKAGDPIAMIRANVARAEVHLAGLFTDEEIVAKLKPLADGGNPRAIFYMSRWIREGAGGMPEDPSKADEFVKISAELGETEAMFEYGEKLRYIGSDDCMIWFKKSFDVDKTRAINGDIEAMYDIGLGCVINGVSRGSKIFVQSQQEADDWLRKAAKMGHAMAAYSLGKRLLDDSSNKAVFDESWSWLNKAAQLGEWRAMLLIGETYYSGKKICISGAGESYTQDVIPVDQRKAQEWFDKVTALVGTDWPVQDFLAMADEDKDDDASPESSPDGARNLVTGKNLKYSPPQKTLGKKVGPKAKANKSSTGAAAKSSPIANHPSKKPATSSKGNTSGSVK